METDLWIIGQVMIDILMMLILFWFVRSHYKKELNLLRHEEVLQRSEAILTEMREISLVLDRNLEEKKALSREILEQLDQGLKNAEMTYQQISKIAPPNMAPLTGATPDAKEPDDIRASVKALLDKGFSKGEVSRHLGISVGEIELLLKLQPVKKSGEIQPSPIRRK